MQTKAWGATTMAIAMLLALAASTPAALAGTVTFDGTTIVFTGGDDLDHELQFRYDPAPPGRDHVIDSQPIDSVPADCQYEGSNTWISCPGKTAVRVELGGGSDSVHFSQGNTLEGDCFNSYVINLGDGNNDNIMNRDCAGPATLTVTAGSGNDTLAGGPAGTTATINAGGGNDTVNPSLLNQPAGDDVIHGGEGADNLWGYGGNDQLFGEGGDDKLRGGAGNDIEDGGLGDDYIGFRAINDTGEDDQGADQLRGGDGADQLFLDGHTGGMAISLNGQPDDGTPGQGGAPGEGDNVGSDIEWILGSPGNDNFTGSPGADYFDGYIGNDEIHGAGGDDNLIGSDGADSLFGDAGKDTLHGATFGCSENSPSTCDSNPGDALFARDGEFDIVRCGDEGTAQVDQLDDVRFCTSVDRQSTPGPGPGPGPDPDPGPGPDPDPGPGPGPDPDPGPGPDTTKPSLSALSLSPTRFRAAGSGPSIATPVGTKVSYALSEVAAVEFRVERALPGRRAGGRCVRPTRSNRHAKRCTRYTSLRGSFTHQGRVGSNEFTFTGRLRGRKLKPGRYRLRGVATDSAGNKSRLKHGGFRIVRR